LPRGAVIRFYDQFGARQDHQAWYEKPALDALVDHAGFDTCGHVVEFGCGTGQLAADCLARHLTGRAVWTATDASATMCRLAADRLARFGNRARVIHTDGSPALPVTDGDADRVVSTYVLDLMDKNDILTLLADAHRVLIPGGLLCLTGLTFGSTPLSRLTVALWRRIYRNNPVRVGGCRPLDMAQWLDPERWQMVTNQTVTARGLVPSAVVVAKRLPNPHNGRP